MPQSLLAAASLLLISQFTTDVRAAWANTDYFDLQQNYCEVEVDGFGYDLCPLMHRINLIEGRGLIATDDNTLEDGGQNSGRRFYEVALGGSHYSERTSSQYLGTSCPEGTWICLLEMGHVKVKNDKDARSKFARTPKRTTAISRKSNTFRAYWTQSIVSSLTVEKDSYQTPLSLIMKLQKSEKEELHAAEITFSCSQVEYLLYKGDDDGVHSFFWATPQGCPMKLSQPLASFMEKISMHELLPRGQIGFAIALLLSFTIIILLTSAIIALVSTLAENLYPFSQRVHKSSAPSIKRVESPFNKQGVNRLVCSASPENSGKALSDSDSDDQLDAQKTKNEGNVIGAITSESATSSRHSGKTITLRHRERNSAFGCP